MMADNTEALACANILKASSALGALHLSGCTREANLR